MFKKCTFTESFSSYICKTRVITSQQLFITETLFVSIRAILEIKKRKTHMTSSSKTSMNTQTDRLSRQSKLNSTFKFRMCSSENPGRKHIRNSKNTFRNLSIFVKNTIELRNLNNIENLF